MKLSHCKIFDNYDFVQITQIYPDSPNTQMYPTAYFMEKTNPATFSCKSVFASQCKHVKCIMIQIVFLWTMVVVICCILTRWGHTGTMVEETCS